MAQFDVRYLVDGKVVRERVTADDLEEVRAGAQMRGSTLLSATKAGGGLSLQLGGPKRVKPEHLNQFVRMFATLVSADLPVLQALRMMVKETEHPALAAAIEAVASDVESGSSLASAFERHPAVFPSLLVSTVGAAEDGGFLDRALVSTADALEDQAKLAADIKSAATYPLIVLCLGVIVSIAMLIFLLPRFAGMFDGLGGELPMFTQVVMGVADVVKWAAAPVAVLGAAGGFWYQRNKGRDSVRAVIDPIKLKLPIFGPINRKVAVSRMTSTLALLLGSGVPMLRAIPKAAPTANNVVIGNALLAAGVYVELGQSLSDHLSDGGAIPTLVSGMLAAGEKVGKPEEMLSRVADSYREQVSRETKQLTSTLEPLLITAIALMVGTQMIAIYLPMFSIFDLIG